MSAEKISAIAPIAAGPPGLVLRTVGYTAENHETQLEAPSIAEKETVNVPVWAATGAIVIGEQPRLADSSKVQESLPPGAVFDETRFREYVSNDNKLVLKVVRRFLADTPGRMIAMRAALNACDAPIIASIAHSLKGAVGFFAAGAALDAAREVETIARTGDLQNVAAAGATLGSEITRLTTALEAFLACTLSRTQP